jgi:hypothetical protein
MHLWNFGKLLPDYMAKEPKNRQSPKINVAPNTVYSRNPDMPPAVQEVGFNAVNLKR